MPDYRRVILYGGVFIGPYLVYQSTADVLRAQALAESGAQVEARVVDTRVVPGSAFGSVPESQSVRYAFDVNGRTYSYTDTRGEADAWADLTPDAFTRAGSAHTLAVRYDRTDPTRNAPVDALAVPVLHRVVGVLAGLLCTLVSLGGLVATLLGRRRQSTAPQP